MPARLASALPALLALVACAGVLAAPASAGADALGRAHESGRLSTPAYALERARSLVDLGDVRRRHPGTERPGPHDVTGILRDLRAAVPLLRGHERREAERILARPSDGAGDAELHSWPEGAAMETLCAEVCLHWIETGTAAPPPADADGDGTPDWAERSLGALETALARFDTLGYRRPRSDLSSATPEVDGRLDVYLDDLGRHGYFGYCTTDDDDAWRSRRVSAYCVLDNDYLDPRLGLDSPVAGLRATSAHELFHAVQFAYDWLEVTIGRGIASSRVTALVVRPGGDVERRRIVLDGNGSGRAVVPFGLGVRRVDLVLANAGTSYRCWRGTALSCGGVSLDDGRPFAFSAALR